MVGFFLTSSHHGVVGVVVSTTGCGSRSQEPNLSCTSATARLKSTVRRVSGWLQGAASRLGWRRWWRWVESVDVPQRFRSNYAINSLILRSRFRGPLWFGSKFKTSRLPGSESDIDDITMRYNEYELCTIHVLGCTKFWPTPTGRGQTRRWWWESSQSSQIHRLGASTTCWSCPRGWKFQRWGLGSTLGGWLGCGNFEVNPSSNQKEDSS